MGFMTFDSGGAQPPEQSPMFRMPELSAEQAAKTQKLIEEQMNQLRALGAGHAPDSLLGLQLEAFQAVLKEQHNQLSAVQKVEPKYENPTEQRKQAEATLAEQMKLLNMPPLPTMHFWHDAPVAV